MRIVGAKELLGIKDPKLMYEFWIENQGKELIENPTIEQVISIIKEETTLDKLTGTYYMFNFSVWVCNNKTQIWPVIKPYDGQLGLANIDIIRHTDPARVIWFVFEESEWEYLDSRLGTSLSRILKSIWERCIPYITTAHGYGIYSSTDEAIQYLNEHYSDYRYITELNIELKFPKEAIDNRLREIIDENPSIREAIQKLDNCLSRCNITFETDSKTGDLILKMGHDIPTEDIDDA